MSITGANEEIDLRLIIANEALEASLGLLTKEHLKQEGFLRKSGGDTVASETVNKIYEKVTAPTSTGENSDEIKKILQDVLKGDSHDITATIKKLINGDPRQNNGVKFREGAKQILRGYCENETVVGENETVVGENPMQGVVKKLMENNYHEEAKLIHNYMMLAQCVYVAQLGEAELPENEGSNQYMGSEAISILIGSIMQGLAGYSAEEQQASIFTLNKRIKSEIDKDYLPKSDFNAEYKVQNEIREKNAIAFKLAAKRPMPFTMQVRNFFSNLKDAIGDIASRIKLPSIGGWFAKKKQNVVKPSMEVIAKNPIFKQPNVIIPETIKHSTESKQVKAIEDIPSIPQSSISETPKVQTTKKLPQTPSKKQPSQQEHQPPKTNIQSQKKMKKLPPTPNKKEVTTPLNVQTSPSTPPVQVKSHVGELIARFNKPEPEPEPEPQNRAKAITPERKMVSDLVKQFEKKEEQSEPTPKGNVNKPTK